MATGRVKRGQVAMTFRTHGGKRRGAGRKARRGRATVRHRTRPAHNARHPVHVTIRVVANVSSLRRRDIYFAIRAATVVAARRADFRIVHLSIQGDHLHVVAEAHDKSALSNGIRGFSISAAKRINRAIGKRTGERRTGKVIADRFHARPLTSPRVVRAAIAYVLNNWRHHGEDRGELASWCVDPFSSGVAFAGWKEPEGARVRERLPPGYQPLVVDQARTWLLRNWSDHHPLISTREVPGA